MTTRRDFLLSAIAIALLAAIVALLVSGAWERADATPSEAPEGAITSAAVLPVAPQGLRGAPLCSRETGGWRAGTGQRRSPGDAVPSPVTGSESCSVDEKPGIVWERSTALEPQASKAVRPLRVVPAVIADAAGGAPPSGAVGTVLVGGFATWYDDPRKTGRYAAAGPLIREALGDWRGKTIRVTSGDRSTVVVLSDWCACGERHDWPTLLDLSPAAFGDLAPLSQGVVFVEIELVDRPDQSGEDPPPHPADERMRQEDGGPRVTAPPTDVAP